MATIMKRDSISEAQIPNLNKTLLFVLKVSNSLISLTWIYHGVVPKLMFMETGELEMLTASGFVTGFEKEGGYAAGKGEILFGLAFLFLGRLRILHYLNIFSLLALGIT